MSLWSTIRVSFTQKDIAWSIVPNVFRGEKLITEYDTIQNAVRHNPFEFRELSEFETLTKLQHYGLGTRLLDVTLNPLVALYFATAPAVAYNKGKDGRYKQEEKDGAIFFNYVPWHSVSELGVRIAMTIPFIDFKKSFSVQGLLEYLKENNVVNENEAFLLQQDDFKLFLEYIQENYFIVSTQSNERLVRQSGAFVLPTAIKISDSQDVVANKKIEKAHQALNNEFQENYFVIPSKYKARLREELDFFNINEATMFPELEHQMTYIENKNCRIQGETPEFTPYIPSAVHNIDPMNQMDVSSETADIEKVIQKVVPNASDIMKSQLARIAETGAKNIDWKTKDSIRSKIRLELLRQLQGEYSATASREFSIRILNYLLNPTDELITE